MHRTSDIRMSEDTCTHPRNACKECSRLLKLTLTQLRNTGLRRLSTRAFDLPEESQMLLISMAEKLRASEGLPAVPPDCTPSSNVLDT